MNKEFVPYDIALAMKDIGFDEECLRYYFNEHRMRRYNHYTNDVFDSDCYIKNDYSIITDSESNCTAPLYQQAFRWFRENYSKHNVPLGTLRLADEKVIFHINGPRNPVAFEKVYDTYEEAQIACLKMLIDSVIKQKEQ